MSPSVFDMGELVTMTSRPAVAQALARGNAFQFDYVGSPTDIRGDADAHQRCFQRLMNAAVDLLVHGTLNIFGMSQQVEGRARVAVSLTLVVSGDLVGPTALHSILERLALPVPDAQQVSHGRCPFLDAGITCSTPDGSQAMLQVKFEADGIVRSAPAPYAHGASVFIVHPHAEAAEGLAGRLRRLGWDTSILASDEGMDLVVSSQLVHPPSLIMLLDTRSGDLWRLNAARKKFPGTPVLLAVPSGSPLIGAAGEDDDDVRVVPLLPSELWDITSPLADSDDGGASRPMPLQPLADPVVLIADDNEVNVAVAEGLLRILGYATRAVVNGQEAVDSCEQSCPAAVLMDLDMPVMDGYEASRQLKALQRMGHLPGFPIIAFSAGGDAVTATANGMDDFLDKPVAIGALKRALFRALKGRAPPLR